MKLSELEPQLLSMPSEDGRSFRTDVSDVASAAGIMFLCPKCYAANGGPVGTHSVICWTPKVQPDMDPKPGRWNLVGTSLADLSLVAGSSSVLLMGGCRAHFFVRNGAIEGLT